MSLYVLILFIVKAWLWRQRQNSNQARCRATERAWTGHRSGTWYRTIWNRRNHWWCQ